MITGAQARHFSKSDLGLLLLTLYCVVALAFLLTGPGALWLRSWGPAIPRLFHLPAGSMEPALEPGDIMISIMHAWQKPKPRRGDIVVFKLPREPSTSYIKRVIGLPGDEIQVVEGILHINGQPVQRERVEDYKTTDLYGRTVPVPRYRETLPEGTSHDIIERDGDDGYWDDTDPYTVPPDHYFMLGDNRDNSSDSRDEVDIGMIPVANISGYPALILMSKDRRRIGSTLH